MKGFPMATVTLSRTPGIAATNWAAQAMCTGKTELFFEPPGERRGRRQRREATARSYCAVCPVATPCREAGRQNRENGIWGGENDEERALAGYAPASIFRRDVAEARRTGIKMCAFETDDDIEGVA